MDNKKILTNEEVIERAKAKNLSDEELEKISGGEIDNWIWTSVYKIVTWENESDVQFIFNFGDTIKIWELFGGGESGCVVNRKKEYSSEDGGWIDKYLVDTGAEVNYWCKRDVIVYQD